VAAQPIEIIPVAHLIFHLGLIRFTGTDPDTTAVPIYLTGNDIAKRAILNTLDRLPVIGLITPLQAHHHIKFLPLSFFSRRQHPAHPRYINGHGLLHEHVLALPYSLLKMNRPEAR